jgi:hypothetical protein
MSARLYGRLFTELDPNTHGKVAPETHGVLQPLRGCELIVNNLSYRTSRNQHFESVTGLSGWSYSMYSRLNVSIPSFQPPNQVNTLVFRVGSSHAIVYFSTICSDSLSCAATSKLCLVSLV